MTEIFRVPIPYKDQTITLEGTDLDTLKNLVYLLQPKSEQTLTAMEFLWMTGVYWYGIIGNPGYYMDSLVLESPFTNLENYQFRDHVPGDPKDPNDIKHLAYHYMILLYTKGMLTHNSRGDLTMSDLGCNVVKALKKPLDFWEDNSPNCNLYYHISPLFYHHMLNMPTEVMAKKFSYSDEISWDVVDQTFLNLYDIYPFIRDLHYLHKSDRLLLKNL